MKESEMVVGVTTRKRMASWASQKGLSGISCW